MKYCIISASCKGRNQNHLYQDHLRVFESDTSLIAVVADGLGSVVSSSRGSELICQIFCEFAENIDWKIPDIQKLSGKAICEWYKRLENKGVSPSDCCTTCSFVLLNKSDNVAYFGQIGDSPIFYRIDEGRVNIVSQEKEFLNETTCIGSSVYPEFFLREEHFCTELDFMVTTDGFGDEVVLDTVDALFDYFKAKYSKIKLAQRSNKLKIELTDTMRDKNNDDKSIIFGWTCQ